MRRIKRCSKCHIWKPLNEFHNRKKGSSDGKVSQCRDCKNEYGRSYFKTTGYRKKEIEELSDNYIKECIRRTLKIPRSLIGQQQVAEKRTAINKARQTPKLYQEKQRLINQRSKLKNKIKALSGAEESEKYKEKLDRVEYEYMMFIHKHGNNPYINDKRRLINKRYKLRKKINSNKVNPKKIDEFNRQLLKVEEEFNMKYVYHNDTV